jgi:hypothetical protein
LFHPICIERLVDGLVEQFKKQSVAMIANKGSAVVPANRETPGLPSDQPSHAVDPEESATTRKRVIGIFYPRNN